MSLSTLILVAMAVGIGFGAVLHDFFPTVILPLDLYLLSPTGTAFLRLIQFVVVPIVFSSLILGLTRIQNAAQVGRYAVKLIVSYCLTSGIAVALGLIIAVVVKPGVGVSVSTDVQISAIAQQQSLIDWLVSLIPTNPIEALSTGNLLQVIFSSALIGVAIQLVGEKAASFVSFVESCYVISEKILSIVLYVAPIGVFALVSSVIATEGLQLIVKLFTYVFSLFVSTLIMITFYVLILAILKAKPIKLLQSLVPALSLAFGTASSNAALPVVLKNVQEDYGLREDIASFAVPLGTALKRDGSAILQGFNAVFIAQMFDISLTPSLLLAIVLSTFLVSFSTPGVPGSGIIMMTTVLTASGLPVEGVAIVAGIDRLTDGFKTVLNIIGNVSNAVILNAWEDAAAPQPTDVTDDVRELT
ncbi:dicarboxylate/amino acid:cation symporter [Leptolyngbya sp. FACHB-17]|uniref:dicarboxylate/amino acid:cation symporter n=1 Tax=unclassified Leptolyngbya TaxID=2650499 RepID=UPI0016805507|nr:dicarboxylate/amino acid:cation symporter [Leptolyngbya sp. FACHB-17]MBD2081947.1 dicarboxylate/amino acid:cation symporter [Leptolyngbya sp. FACHB-17]